MGCFDTLCPGVTHGSQVSSTSGHTGSRRECVPDVVMFTNFVAGCIMGDMLEVVGLGGGPKRDASGGRSLFCADGKLLWCCW